MKFFFYSFTVSVNKCCGSCVDIDDPYSWICVPNKVNNMNLKVFNLLLGVNELSECKYELDENVSKSKKTSNRDKS